MSLLLLCDRSLSSHEQIRDIVLQCGNCVEFINAPSMGINPHRLRPLDAWQMDVMHIPAFGKLQYVHVFIDTSSGVLYASPLTGEKAVHVISHCLEAWVAWGKPLVLKTDNGPAYTTSKFSQFCKQMQVKHIIGLPYDPQSQGIIETAHRTLKQYLQKERRGIESMTPKMALSLAIFTLNFLKLDDAGRSPAGRHGQRPQPPNEMIKWKKCP
jgi:transposase InsO family protein